jgi:lysophospholipase L1-like esterase
MEMIEQQVSNRRHLRGTLKNIYTAVALIVLTTLVLLAVINVLLFGVFYIKDSAGVDRTQRPKDGRLFNSDGSPADNGRRTSYELTWFDYGSYENIPEEYAADVLDDFYDLSRLGFIYQPWVEFSEPPFSGKRVHIDRDIRGFPVRRTINPARQTNRPIITIFVFGGSTTFGYNVSDEHTWPSYLSRVLNETSGVDVQVINYGRGYFNPSQEAILLQDLLKSGHRPSLALFMDGLNPPRAIDVPKFTQEVAEGYRQLQFPPSYSEQFAWISIIRLANFLRRNLFGRVTADTAPATDPKMQIENAVNGFRQSRNISSTIATLYDVPTLFFLQPNSVYNYNTRLFRNQSSLQGLRDDRTFMTGLYRQLKSDKEYIDLSDLFAEWGDRKAVVDDCHYSPSFNEFLAHRVAEFIHINLLEPRAMAAPTGGVRTQ